MATKTPTTALRDRRPSASSSPVHRSSVTASHSSRPSPRTLLSSGTDVPTMSKKSVPNYLKPKASPPHEPPARRALSISSVTVSTGSKTPSITRPVNKPPSPVPIGQTQRAQSLTTRPAKPASMAPMPSCFSKQNGDKAASRLTTGSRNSPATKAKSTILTPIQKREVPATLVSLSSPEKLSTDHDVQRPMQEPLPSNPEKVEAGEHNRHYVVEDSHLLEEQKECELARTGESSKQQGLDEVIREPALVDTDPKQARVVVATAVVEKDEKGKVYKAEKAKVEAEVVSRVEPEARKMRLGVTVPTVVAVTPGNKKDAPRSNDVIEETKSKLMGTRKNRVLALVGAFETVISLQEPEGQQSQKGFPVQNDPHVQEVEQSHGNQHDQPIGESQNGQQVESGDEVHHVEESKCNGSSLEGGVEVNENKALEEILQQVGRDMEVNQNQQSIENDEQTGGGGVVHQDQQSLQNGQHEKDNDEQAGTILKEEEIGVALVTGKAEPEEKEEIEEEQERIVNLVCDDTNLDLSLASVVEEIGES